MARLSGLQRDVLSLYRKCLREIRKKPTVSIFQPALRISSDRSSGIKAQLQSPCPVSFVFPGGILPSNAGYRAEFQKHLSVNKKDFSAVEYLLRKGHRQLEMYASPGIRNIR